MHQMYIYCRHTATRSAVLDQGKLSGAQDKGDSQMAKGVAKSELYGVDHD